MTYSQAVAKARKLAKERDCEYFVVEEIKGEIDVVDGMTLDSFYAGIAERNVLYCTSQWD
jgi:hypothetical protein